MAYLSETAPHPAHDVSLFDTNKRRGRRNIASGLVVFREYGEILIAQAAPPKRGRNIKSVQREQVRYFRNVQQIFPYTPPHCHQYYLALAEGGPFLPRDYWTMNAYGRLWELETVEGKRVMPTRTRFDVSNSLDVLGEEEGALLVRGTDWWETVKPAQTGYVLTSRGPGQMPHWQPGGGGGGSSPWTIPDIADWTNITGGSSPDLVETLQPGIGAQTSAPTWTGTVTYTYDTAPSTNTITLGFTAISGRQNQWWFMLYWLDGTDGPGVRLKLEFERNETNIVYQVFEMNSLIPYSSNGLAVQEELQPLGPMFLQCKRDAGNISVSIGADPAVMSEIYSFSDGTAAAALDTCAIQTKTYDNDQSPTSFQIFHFKEE